MYNKQELREFASSLLEDKQRDIMHNIDHSDRMLKAVGLISLNYQGQYEEDIIVLAAYFHGPINYSEEPIRAWLKEKGYGEQYVEKVVKAAWESQAKYVPESLEGKLLHDAHTIEGGKAYFILKPLMVGTIIGQTFNETIRFIEDKVIGKSKYYLSETKVYIDESERYARDFIENLKRGL